MAHPTGESKDGALKLDFDRRLMVQFRGCVVTSDAGLCFPVCAAALRPAQAGPASHHRSLARSVAACMGARWDQAPHVATRARLSMAALRARLLRNARTFENWCGRRASCCCRLSKCSISKAIAAGDRIGFAETTQSATVNRKAVPKSTSAPPGAARRTRPRRGALDLSPFGGAGPR